MIRHAPMLLLFFFLCLVLAACEDQPSHGPAKGAADAREADAFYEQPLWQAYLDRHVADGPFSPRRSDWERVEALEQSERLAREDLCGDSESAVAAWARARDLIGPLQGDHLDIRIRARELEDGGVEGLLQRWGFKDDSVAGVDHRLRFSKANDCLLIQRVEARHYCRRGIEQGARCL